MKKLTKLQKFSAFSIGFLFLVLMLTSGNDSEKEEGPKDYSTKAWICAQEEVKKNLKSPATADFPFLDYSKLDQGDNTYLIKSYVDSENGFGATIRTNFTCSVMVVDPTNFLCESSCTYE